MPKGSCYGIVKWSWKRFTRPSKRTKHNLTQLPYIPFRVHTTIKFVTIQVLWGKNIAFIFLNHDFYSKGIFVILKKMQSPFYKIVLQKEKFQILWGVKMNILFFTFTLIKRYFMLRATLAILKLKLCSFAFKKNWRISK